MRELTIDGRRIADDEPAYVIAEIGHNHRGDLATAISCIRAAAASGTHAVKFQKRDVLNLYTPALLRQPYENENSYGSTYGLHRLALELTCEQYVACRDVALVEGVTFFATAFDEASADLLMDVDVPAFKIASGDLTNTPLLRHVATLGKPVIVSTGGATFADVDRAVEMLSRFTGAVALLHCTAAYPVRDFAELNLEAIVRMRAAYPNHVIGWSGHDSGIAMGIVAYALGARIIEKHFTLNRAMKGTDHAFSLEPPGLKKLVRDLGRARLALGDGEKRRYPSEDAPLRKMAKALVAVTDLPAGHVLRAYDLARKTPSDGLPPYLLDHVVGFTLSCAMAQDEPLTYAHLGGSHVA